MLIIIVLVFVGAVLWWLFRVRQRDMAQCQAVLGLAPAQKSPPKPGTTPEGFAAFDHRLLEGTLLGRPASFSLRRVRSPKVARRDRRGSDFTVLSFTLQPPASVSLRIQPTGLIGAVETWVRGTPGDRVSVDATFDDAFTIYSDTPAAALAVLTPALRERLLEFHARILGTPTASTSTKLASGLVIGTFHIDGSTARYLVPGSPTKSTAEQVMAAAPVLLEVATAASG